MVNRNLQFLLSFYKSNSIPPESLDIEQAMKCCRKCKGIEGGRPSPSARNPLEHYSLGEAVIVNRGFNGMYGIELFYESKGVSDVFLYRHGIISMKWQN